MPVPPAPDPLAAVTRPFRGVIFDCDGTLADTMPLHYRAWTASLAARSAGMSEQLFYDLGVEETAADKEARYEELLPQAEPVERVVELVREY